MYINADAIIYAGPDRSAGGWPVVGAGVDYVPGGGWTDVSAQVAKLDVVFDGHEHQMTVTLAGWAMETDTWIDDRQVLVRARWQDDQTGWTAYQVVFSGFVTGGGEGRSAASEAGLAHSGTITCRQHWHYLSSTRLPALAFGWSDLVRGRPATASSTLPTVMSEAGLEYLTTSSVGPEQAVDGNRDTVWISNTVADPTPPTLLTTGKKIIISEVYNGRGNAGTLGANGQPLWIELWCADVVLNDGFESGISASWQRLRGATATADSAWAASGSLSMRINATAAGSAVTRDIGGLIANVECATTFTVRSATGSDIKLDVGIAGDGQTVWQIVTAPAVSTGARYTIRREASRNGSINIRIASKSATDVWWVDDVRVSGGMNLAETGQPYKKAFLVWDDGLGGSGFGDLASKLGILSIGGERNVILTDDADLFRASFDAGDATVVQMRNLDGDQNQSLRNLDFASGRGRLRIAWYRRWPDLPDTGGTIWDDLQFASAPAFTATQSLVRTVVSPLTMQARTNPAPGGAETAGTAWLQADLGAYTAPTITASMGTASSLTFDVTSTAKFPAYGNAYIDNEVMFLQKLNATQFTAIRGAPVSHTSGSGVYPQLNNVKVTLPLVSVVGWRRRPNVPTIVDFDIIGSALPSPRDPAVAVSGGTWGSHPDWFPLAVVRGWSGTSFVARVDWAGTWAPTSWPPASGTTTNWGRQVRWLRLVIHRMQTWGGQKQRAKINELLAFEADLSSGGSGEYAGTAPADLRGIVGHILTQYGGIALTALQVDKGDAGGIGWGASYGSLPIAPTTASEALADLEGKGLQRVFVTAGGIVRVVPDPLSTSAAYQSIAWTWTATTLWRLQTTRRAAHQVAQAVVSARNEGTGEVFRSAYPRQGAQLGQVLDISGRFAGSQADADAMAARGYRQGNARWQGVAEAGPMPPPIPLSRHLLTYTAGDLAAVEVAGRSMLVAGYSWSFTPGAGGGVWTTTVTLEELAA